MSVQSTVLSLITGDSQEPDTTKAVTVRLSLSNYATLASLAHFLNLSPSGLLKTLSDSAIKEALNTYLATIPDDQSEFGFYYQDYLDSLVHSLQAEV